MIINGIIPRFNNIQQTLPIRHQRSFIAQTDDNFIKQPSFCAKPEVKDFVKLFNDAVKKNNGAIYERATMEHYRQPGKEHFNMFEKEIKPILKKGLNSNTQEIRDLFSAENLCSLLDEYRYSTLLATEDGKLFDLAKIYFSQTKDTDKRKMIAEEMVYWILNKEQENNPSKKNWLSNILNKHTPLIKKLSQFPMSEYERYLLRIGNEDYSKELFKPTMKARLNAIISRNGIKTPEEILNCLNDQIMTPEILEIKYKGTRLINRIAKIPVKDNNKETLSKIAEKLAEMNLPDNEIFRNAGVTAAKNSNIELLKAFNSRRVHYMNTLKEPIESFPPNVQEVLSKAKINDKTLLLAVEFNTPDFIKAHLYLNPNVDINSRDEEGDTILLKAVKNQNIEILEILAKCDDVDWNVLDKEGKNILLQMLRTDKQYNYGFTKKEYTLDFEQKLLKLLQELPKGKFDINYATYIQYWNDTTIYGCFATQACWTMRKLVKFPDFNPMTKLIGRPTIAELFSNHGEFFEKIIEHPNFDSNLLKDPQINLDFTAINILSERADKQTAKQFQDIYDKNGYLEEKEIEMFINYSGLKNIMNHNFNIVKENIAHLLVDISPDANKIKEYSQLFEKLKQAKFDFNSKDLFDRTPLDKARECENTAAIEILMKLNNR